MLKLMSRCGNRRALQSAGCVVMLLGLIALPVSLLAQPIAHPFTFAMPGRDTTMSRFLPQVETPAGKHGELHVSQDGHIIAKDGTRLRFFGTELQYTSNFLSGADAHTLALRLHKLGFNAVRLAVFDYWPWDDASIFSLYDSTGTANYYNSYLVGKPHQAALDTLLYEFKQAGIYTILGLNGIHEYAYNEVPMRDSIVPYYYWLLRFVEPTAHELDRKWVGRFMTHVNPLTGTSYAGDPSIAVAELSWSNTPYYYWQLGRLNWTDSNNVAPRGNYTVNYYLSKRLDTLWATFLKNKYGSDAGVNGAWVGNGNVNPANLMADGSFEDVNPAPWSFVQANGAKASFVVADGGVDSATYEKIRIADLSATPALGNIYAMNLSTVLGQDSLYELTFWAKMAYDAKRPTVTSRTIYLYLFNYGTGAVSISQYATIDTAWRKYSITFRSVASGLHAMVTYVGNELGDVWIDAYNIHHKQEQGLLASESINNSTVVRLTPTNLTLFPLQRERDMVMFIDSLELSYYLPIQKLLRDTLHFAGLVNFTQQNYWTSPPEQYVSSFSEVTESYVGWDYFNSRPKLTFSDTNWSVQNIPEVKSTNAGNFGYYMPSASIDGKPFFATVQVPVVNQYSAEHVSILSSYGGYQDWDGIFVAPYSSYRFDLFNDSLENPFTNATNSYSAYAVHANNAMLALTPAASAAFRSGAIHAAEVYQPVEHDADDVWLSPTRQSGRGPWGVEGYLDPNIITQVRVRQKFNAHHKVAAQYAIIRGDTAIKVSDTGELTWDQTNGQIRANTSRLDLASGFFGADTAVFGMMKLSRKDGVREMLNVSYLSLDSLPLDSTAASLLTISTRSQNTNASWKDSLSNGLNWGTSPMVMSAATLDLLFKSQYDSLLIFPLDAQGALRGQPIVAAKINSDWFAAHIDQRATPSAWFYVEKKNSTEAVTDHSPEPRLPITLSPNPATQRTQLRFFSPSAASAKIEIIDELGRVLWAEKEPLAPAGLRTIPIKLDQLAEGHYVVKVSHGSEVVTANLNIVR